MIFSLRTPRINNNDDTVTLSTVHHALGAFVREGETVAEVESDKATFTVEAIKAGYFLQCMHNVGETIAVGSVLAWFGESADDIVPTDGSALPGAIRATEPTLKAALLLEEYGLAAADVPAASERLSVADVQAYIEQHALQPGPRGVAIETAPAPTSSNTVSVVAPHTDVQSRSEDLTVVERGMMRTVSWHARVAVPGYVEIVGNAKAWEEYGATFQKQHGLLMNPMLALIAYRLVALTATNPKYNATVHNDRKVLYQSVNIGFTVQSGENLYLTVSRDSQLLSADAFVTRMLDLQKAAMKNKIKAAETSGATVAFTSMARWGVVRHQPLLAPHTSLMIAHSAASSGQAAFGATYDHRLLTGGDAVAALHFLNTPPEA